MKLHYSLAALNTSFQNITESTINNDISFGMYKHSFIAVNGNLVISNIQFESQVEIRNGYDIKFVDCVFNNGIILSVGINADVMFDSCFLLGEINFSGHQQKNLVVKFHECKSDVMKLKLAIKFANVQIIHSEFSEVECIEKSTSLLIDNCEIDKVEVDSESHKNLKILDSKVTSLRVTESENAIVELICSEVSEVFMSSFFSLFEILSSKVDNIHLKLIRKKSVLRLSGKSEIGLLHLSNCNGIHVDMKYAYINELKLDEIHGASDLSIRNIKKLEYLELNSVSVPVRLSHLMLKKLAISNTEFQKINLSHIHWSNRFELLSARAHSNEMEKYLDLVETSRELKQYFTKKQNEFYAETFRISELRSHFYYLKSLIVSRHFNFLQFVDWLVLGTNKWFSNFGTNPLLSISYLLGFHFLLFLPLLILFNPNLGYSFCLNPFDENCSIAFSLNLLNPIHSLSDIDGNKVYSVVDFFMRLSSGYFIYYFLRGTRKFGRS
ncbi:MAG: hypothetical protein ABJF11_16825 [Reichenbachiella sp.]|uniref:hypothetical protein n=1 Tax=Reichenbachiella sp. TaxID=2184521 RepID=UPI003263AFA4